MFKNNKNIDKNLSNKNSNISLKKLIFFTIFIFLILLINLVIITNNYLSKINKITIDKNDLSIKEYTLEKSEDNIIPNNDINNIALFGIDETEGIKGRSDCIMILTVDNIHKKLKLSSIIRDSYVVIPTKDKKDKINHAYAFGGPQLAVKTLNTNFNLNLSQFVTVNFSSLPKIIDEFGGITLDITTDELKHINNYINDLNHKNGTNSPNIITSGSQKVDGTQALAYCRIRYTDGGDFERSKRHRTVINQIIDKCKNIPLSQYSSFLDELLPLVDTNLESSEILSIAVNLSLLKDCPLLQDSFPRDEDSNGKLIGGIYYYVFDENTTTQKMHQFIFE